MQISVAYELAQGGRWYLVHTRPNSERKAELNLKAQGFATFLPQVEKTIRHARRFTSVRRPLFSRYLFVRLDIDRDRWLSVNSTIGVSRLFTQEGRPTAVPIGIVETLLAHSDAGLTRLDQLAGGRSARAHPCRAVSRFHGNSAAARRAASRRYTAPDHGSYGSRLGRPPRTLAGGVSLRAATVLIDIVVAGWGDSPEVR